SVGIGAHEQLAVVRHMRRRGPYLLPRDDVVVTIADGTGAQPGEVGAGLRLGEPLAPHVLAAQDPREVESLLIGRPLGDQGGAGVQGSHEVAADVGRARSFELFEEHQLLAGGGAAPAVFGWPADAGVSGGEEAALPTG